MTETLVAVVGAGVMGTGIAQNVALAGCDVILVDRLANQLATAERLLREGRFGMERAVERGKLDRESAEAALSRVAFAETLDGIISASMVIEATFEDLTVKMGVFAELGKWSSTDSVLASNTSGLPIAAMAAASGRPEQVVGWHWASPAQVSPFAEIARCRYTSDESVNRVVAMARRCGKRPVVITENERVWGFVANRVYSAAVREAERVVAEGLATRDEVDALVCDAYRWPVGPFALIRGANEGWGDQRDGSVASLHVREDPG